MAYTRGAQLKSHGGPKVSFACAALRFKTNEIICCLTSKKNFHNNDLKILETSLNKRLMLLIAKL